MEAEERSQHNEQQNDDNEQDSHAVFVVGFSCGQEDDQVEGDDEGLQCLEKQEEGIEQFVLLSNAGAHPGAVVVEGGDALLAAVAVFDP